MTRYMREIATEDNTILTKNSLILSKDKISGTYLFG